MPRKLRSKSKNQSEKEPVLETRKKRSASDLDSDSTICTGDTSSKIRIKVLKNRSPTEQPTRLFEFSVGIQVLWGKKLSPGIRRQFPITVKWDTILPPIEKEVLRITKAKSLDSITFDVVQQVKVKPKNTPKTRIESEDDWNLILKDFITKTKGGIYPYDFMLEIEAHRNTRSVSPQTSTPLNQSVIIDDDPNDDTELQSQNIITSNQNEYGRTFGTSNKLQLDFLVSIQRKWACKKHNRTCYINKELDIHNTLSDDLLRSWAIACCSKVASIANPPRTSEFQKAFSTDPLKTPNLSSIPQFYPGIPPNSMFPMFSQPPLPMTYLYPGYSQQLPEPRWENQNCEPSIPVSSPINSEYSDDEKLENFFEYAKRKGRIIGLEESLNRLLEQNISIEYILKAKGRELYDYYEITEGKLNKLQSLYREWKKDFKKNH